MSSSGVEKVLRRELAAAYRLFDLFGWTDLIYNHLTVRVPDSPGSTEENPHFLINPFGLLWDEITASSLVKVDLEGSIIDPGSTSYGINKAGYVIHSALHRGRSDLHSIMHSHANPAVAISALSTGLKPIAQNTALLGPIAYHDYEGIALRMDEQERLIANMGPPPTKIMILRNHGVIVGGETIAEAFCNHYNVIKACEYQLTVDSNPALSPLSASMAAQVAKEHQANMTAVGGSMGALEWAGLLRRLDRLNPGYDDM